MLYQRWRTVIAVAATLVCQPAAWASEVDVLLNLMVEKGMISASEAQSVRNEVNPVVSKQEQTLDERFTALEKGLPEVAGNWKWKGDIRLRNEFRKTDPGLDKNRQRIRFRYGVKAKVSDDLDVGARMATGSDSDPVSTNQSLNVNFNKVNWLLDRAYVSYHPAVGDVETRLVGGIVANPFWSPGPLVWDGDLNFHGAAAQFATSLSSTDVFINGGAFSLDTDQPESANLWATQGGLTVEPMDDVKLTTALAYYDYRNVTSTAEDNAISFASGQGITSATLEDLNLINWGSELSLKAGDYPVKFWGDWVHNTAARDEENGYQAGIKIGKAKKPWSLKDGWEAGWYWQHLERDAAFASFVDSDFHGGGTNNQGSAYFVNLAVLKNSKFGVKWFDTKELLGSSSEKDTVQFDWVTEF